MTFCSKLSRRPLASGLFFLLLASAILAAAVVVVVALDEQVELELPRTSSDFQVMTPLLRHAFGFDQGGSLLVEAHISPSSANLLFVMVSMDQYLRMYTASTMDNGLETTYKFCAESGSQARYQWRAGSLLFNHTIEHRNRYAFLILDCENVPAVTTGRANLQENSLKVAPFTHSAASLPKHTDNSPLRVQDNAYEQFIVRAHVVSINPGGEHLTLELVPLIPVSYLFSVLFLGLIVFFLIRSIINRKYLTLLHPSILLMLVVKLIALVVTIWYYSILSYSGNTSELLRIAKEITIIAPDTFLLLICILIASGWTLAADDQIIAPRERNILRGMLFVYVSARVLAVIQAESSLYIAQLIINTCQFMLLFRTVIAMNTLIELLRRNIRSSATSMESQARSAVHWHMLTSWRLSFFVFIVSPLIVVVIRLNVLTSWDQEWIVFFIPECIWLFLAASTAYKFSPKHMVPAIVETLQTQPDLADTSDDNTDDLDDENTNDPLLESMNMPSTVQVSRDTQLINEQDSNNRQRR